MTTILTRGDGTISNIIMTSDGIHYIGPSNLHGVLIHSESSKHVPDRLMAMARWLGGSDNASIAQVDIAEARSSLLHDKGSLIEFSDPFGDLFFALDDIDTPTMKSEIAPAPQKPVTPKLTKKTEKRPRPAKKKPKSHKDKKVEAQLKIEIDANAEGSDRDDRE